MAAMESGSAWPAATARRCRVTAAVSRQVIGCAPAASASARFVWAMSKWLRQLPAYWC